MFFCLIHTVFEQKIVFEWFLKSGGVHERGPFFSLLKLREKQFKELPQSANL